MKLLEKVEQRFVPCKRVSSGVGLVMCALLLSTGCATSSIPMATCTTRNPNEAKKVFDKVWLNSTGSLCFRFPWGFAAYETTGQLLLFKDSMEFRKSDGTGFEMRNIQNVFTRCLNMTAFDSTPWVAIEYGLPPNSRTVYFADGHALGWGGVGGGTAVICDAITVQYSK